MSWSRHRQRIWVCSKLDQLKQPPWIRCCLYFCFASWELDILEVKWFHIIFYFQGNILKLCIPWSLAMYLVKGEAGRHIPNWKDKKKTKQLAVFCRQPIYIPPPPIPCFSFEYYDMKSNILHSRVISKIKRRTVLVDTSLFILLKKCIEHEFCNWPIKTEEYHCFTDFLFSSNHLLIYVRRDVAKLILRHSKWRELMCISSLDEETNYRTTPMRKLIQSMPGNTYFCRIPLTCIVLPFNYIRFCLDWILIFYVNLYFLSICIYFYDSVGRLPL